MNRKRVLTFFVSLAATLVFMIVAVVIALGFFIPGSDAIFPNVSVEGINLSGMTVDEAKNKLVGMGFEDNADFVSVTVNFPDGSSFSISGNDAGLSLCADEAASAAFRYGRDASFFKRVHMFVTSLWVETDIKIVPVPDEEFVRSEVAVHTQRFNGLLVESTSYSLNESSIIIIPGSGFAPADEDSVFLLTEQALYTALEEGTHLVVDYIPDLTATNIFDLNELYRTVYTEPVSAVLDPETFIINEGIPGISFDAEAAANRLANARVGEQIEIPLIFTEPEVTTEHLRGILFRDELAVRTTHVAGTANRLSNITLAASYIDGFVLNPGDTFSFNEIVPRRTQALGFRMAGGFIDGELVDVIGGGICQVASNLYDNVLYSNLEVIARRAHTLPITYLPLGHDAAISYGAIDLQFKNNTDYPIRIEIEFDGRSMTTRLIGTRTDDYIIRFEYETTTVPYETVYREDENIPEGEEIFFAGRNGFIRNTYRVIYDEDENMISRTHISRDVYRTQSRVVLIPVAYS
ncbi:MAG: VanW family protein [Clostridiales bacterium]|nr:VanW family protein [Clostridiales bacterium]